MKAGNYCCFFMVVILALFLPGYYGGDSDAGQISESDRLVPGAVNDFFVERNGKTQAVYGDPENELKEAEMVLFTHDRRDVVWVGRELVIKGGLAVVPGAEKAYFTRGDSLGKDIAEGRFVEMMSMTTKISPL